MERLQRDSKLHVFSQSEQSIAHTKVAPRHGSLSDASFATSSSVYGQHARMPSQPVQQGRGVRHICST